MLLNLGLTLLLVWLLSPRLMLLLLRLLNLGLSFLFYLLLTLRFFKLLKSFVRNLSIVPMMFVPIMVSVHTWHCKTTVKAFK